MQRTKFNRNRRCHINCCPERRRYAENVLPKDVNVCKGKESLVNGGKICAGTPIYLKNQRETTQGHDSSR